MIAKFGLPTNAIPSNTDIARMTNALWIEKIQAMLGTSRLDGGTKSVNE
jgi:hypothetical protein